MKKCIKIINDGVLDIYPNIGFADKHPNHTHYLLCMVEGDANVVAYDCDYENLAIGQFRAYLTQLGYTPRQILTLKTTGGQSYRGNLGYRANLE